MEDPTNDPSTLVELLNEFAYCFPLEKFYYRQGGVWVVDKPIGEKGIIGYLQTLGVSPLSAKALIKSGNYRVVHGTDIAPNGPAIVDLGTVRLLNAWRPPTLEATPGQYPRIESILSWHTGHDAEGVRWFKHWIAQKVQAPALCPQVAVVLCSQPGSGKGTLSWLMHEMLGRGNCAEIGRLALESRFNGRWAQALFVLADEVVSPDNYMDISERLKMLIASPTIEMERKRENQEAQTNRMAWIFATNTDLVPVLVEQGDRRYTVFSNFDALTPEHQAVAQQNFVANVPTAEFLAEAQAFFHDMRTLKVDRAFVARPYENQARRVLTEASMPAHQRFMQAVEKDGIDEYLEDSYGIDVSRASRESWDFGAQGVARRVVYKAYRSYCKETGAMPLREAKFFTAVENRRPRWAESEQTNPRNKTHKVKCYVLKRTPTAPHPTAEQKSSAALTLPQ